MNITVQFYSYFKDLTGCSEFNGEVQEGTSIENFLSVIEQQFPKMTSMRHCTLIAVGVEYQTRDYILKPGDEVSLFPPVQGG
jgi:molybdopterin converting factor small subunit